MRYAIIVAVVILASLIALHAGAKTEKVEQSGRLPVAEDRLLNARERIAIKIRRAATEAGVNPETALRIAQCESGLNPLAASKTSSAKGLYQFIDSTWKLIGAEGSPFDEEENIKRFMLNYPRHKSWWECK